jgi:hypothetical protein
MHGLESSGDDEFVADQLRDHVQVLREYRMTLLTMHRGLMESGVRPEPGIVSRTRIRP